MQGNFHHFDGKEAVPDSTRIDHRTCTSSHGHDFTSLYKIYNPLAACKRRVKTQVKKENNAYKNEINLKRIKWWNW